MFRSATLVLGLVVSAGLASAQAPPATVGLGDEAITHPTPGASTSPPSLAAPASQLQLTPAQKTAILNAIRRAGGKAAAPVTFATTVGAPVPPSIELYLLPDSALTEVPEAKIVKYTKVHDQIVLVDPTTMRVVDVIPQSGQ